MTATQISPRVGPINTHELVWRPGFGWVERPVEVPAPVEEVAA